MEKETLLKKLFYRSNHRGCKETDILLGKFFQAKIAEFSDVELQTYALFIDEDDMLIYDWILRKTETPREYVAVVEKIQKFHDL